jgi:hypothetical protein
LGEATATADAPTTPAKIHKIRMVSSQPVMERNFPKTDYFSELANRIQQSSRFFFAINDMIVAIADDIPLKNLQIIYFRRQRHYKELRIS